MSHTRHGRPGPLRRVSAAVVALVVACGLAVAATAPAQAAVAEPAAAGVVKAADLSAFDAGYIVSDEVFYNSGTMTAAAIQQFLDAKVPRCESGYTCLKDWKGPSQSQSANAMCDAYSGSSKESAATIIYKVAQACGINPQVILVMLQKEQGLVTHVWPSSWRFDAAMGYNCPDTTGCTADGIGFFTQVYGGAYMLKRYSNPPGTSQYFTWYAPGKTWNILYNPNTACGSSPVYVRNQATANLYYYTPYQPNKAALAAGYGEGDGCSAYGNRNFFNYFTDWFGSPTSSGGGEVTAGYEDLGGVSGRLGAAITDVVCGLADGGCYQAFEGGQIHWSPATGAYATWGAIDGLWAELDWEGGRLGYPTSAETCGLTGGGCYQEFQGGRVTWSAKTGAYATWGGIGATWVGLKAEKGRLGYPTSAETCGLTGGGCYQEFQGGRVTWSAKTGAYATWGGIGATWAELKAEKGRLGYPASAESCASGICVQTFQSGTISWSSATGAYATWGAIGSTWTALSGQKGQLGVPRSAETCGLTGGGCYQLFLGGQIHWSPTTGAHATWGAIQERWAALGWEKGQLGYPTSNEVCGLTGGGCYQSFQGGQIHWSPGTGAYATWGAIDATWAAAGWENGRYGYPISNEVCSTDKSCSQTFTGGVITWKPAAASTR